MSDNRNTVDKRHRGNRGGVKKRMTVGAMAGLGVLGGPGPMRAFPRPQFLAGPNPLPLPYGIPPRPSFGPMPLNPGPKFGFFDPPQAFGPSNFEKRSDATLKPSGFREVMPKQPGIPPLIRPPIVPDFLSRGENGQPGMPLDRNGPLPLPPLSAQSPIKDGLLGNESTTEGMNELFAKMVWKKLDLIKDPVRLSRLHIEIMNILQMAVAEESSTQPHP